MSSLIKYNYFSLFELPEIFDIDVKALEKKYFELQRSFHPDRFVGKGDKERIAAISKASEINDGYKILKNPLSRAEYLLSLRGIKDIKPSQELLMEAMEQREELSSAETVEKIRDIEKKNNEKREDVIKELSNSFLDGDFSIAAKLTIKLKYLEKFAEEVRIALIVQPSSRDLIAGSRVSKLLDTAVKPRYDEDGL